MTVIDNLDVYILLLLAVGAGWIMGRIGSRSKPVVRNSEDIFHDYFVGLNYLLNDEPDEAIDTFIKALEVNNDTVETHLALGGLLRRRGKVDKAIKVHQALLARQGLDRSFFDSTRLQLALDYIAAGLLDRAERLLKEIRDEKGEAQWHALKHLLTVYQTEKEWQQALDCTIHLLKSPEHKKSSELRSVAAHYCCELASEHIKLKQWGEARDQLKKAFTFDRKHVRTALLLAGLEHTLGNQNESLKELLRVRRQHPEFSSHVVQLLMQWYADTEDKVQLRQTLTAELGNSADQSLVLAVAGLISAQSGAGEAITFLDAYSALGSSLELLVQRLQFQLTLNEGKISAELAGLQDLLATMLNDRACYQCTHCGYESRNLYWLCPSCQNWDKTKPMLNEVTH